MSVPSRAGGFLDPIQSASGAAVAGAGETALGEDAATIWYNPAGMVLLPGAEVMTASGLSFPSASFHNSGSRDAAGLPVAGNTVTNPAVAVQPSVFASFPVNDALRVGFGLLAPFGQSTKYDDNWVGRYQVQQTALATVDLRPAVAYRINGALSLGAVVDIQYADFKRSNAIDFGTVCSATGACAAVPEGADGRLVARVTSWGVGYDLGALWTLTPDFRIGANFKSAIRGAFSGTARYDVPELAAPLTAGGAFGDTSVATTLNFPEIISLGGVWRISSRWTGLLDVSRTQWSEMQQLSFDFGNATPSETQALNWHDAWRVAIGGIYRLDDVTDLRAGLAFDQSPISDQYRTADIPEGDAVEVGLGIRRRLTDHLEISLSYNYYRQANASINSAELGAGVLSGVIRQQVHSLGGQVRWMF